MARNHTWPYRVVLTFRGSGVHEPTAEAPQSVFTCSSGEVSDTIASDTSWFVAAGFPWLSLSSVTVSPPLSRRLPSMQLVSWPFLLPVHHHSSFLHTYFAVLDKNLPA